MRPVTAALLLLAGVQACQAFLSSLVAALPKEGRVVVQGEHELWYRIHRPMALSSQKGAPLLVLHGGPQVPSDYLFDLAQVDYRSVVFFDQLGCGRSASPPASDAEYSIPASVSDLKEIVAALGLRRYHLLGQSWGGILGYEFLRAGGGAGAQEGEGCQSFIISNTPTSVPQVERDAEGLVAALGDPALFSSTHECRLPQRPQPLLDAYAHAGSVWRGTDAIKGWTLQARPPAPAPGGGAPTDDAGQTMLATPVLVLRGEHDFVTADNQRGWSDVFGRVRFKSLPDSSHHTLLEKREAYLEVVDAFCGEFD